MAASPALMKSDSIADNMPEALRERRYQMKRCFARYLQQGKRLMKLHHLMDELEKSIDDHAERTQLLEGTLGYILCSTQEAAVVPPHVAFAVRPNPGYWEYVKVNAHHLTVEGITATEYLKFKETIYDDKWATDENALEVDFGALEHSTPHLTLSSSIGKGMNFVSKFLSSKLWAEKEAAKPLVEHMLSMKHRDDKLMINETLNTPAKLQAALVVADVFLSSFSTDTPFQNFELRLKEWGFEKGWGDTAARVRETMHSLSEVLQAPDPVNVENFFGRLPTIFNIVIFSVHGYFGQANVLGLPDTGGQVVYILDQVRALEEELLIRFKNQGLNVKPQILVVTRLIPDAQGTKCNQELEAIEGTKYSNILRVPFRTENGVLRQWVSRFDIYPYLEKYTQDATTKILELMEGKPDLIIGNYTDGNLVASLMANKLQVTLDNDEHIGFLEDKKKPIIFSMARLDTVKNITGLVEWYGKNERLRSLVNLVVVAGFFDPSKSKDREETAEIRRMPTLIEKYRLKGHFRWIAAQTDKYRNGELYRFIADTRGAFVQPALYEAFGLTVIEAMNCGLPTFATNQGGPAEIIVDGVSGFHIDPHNGDEASNKIADFFQKCKNDDEYWNTVSAASLQRIYECYTWKIYANKLLNMGNMYTFWKMLNCKEKLAKQRYVQMFYNLEYRNLVKTVPIPSYELPKPVPKPIHQTPADSDTEVVRGLTQCMTRFEISPFNTYIAVYKLISKLLLILVLLVLLFVMCWTHFSTNHSQKALPF
ncbi:hypothetical protein SOVF_108390 isoform C [Spinacia oleracea]|nr:hypothetical protein SOVF_108390 isoform C [Spinacia oleracea]